jgi:hypothetical protein
MEHRNHDNQAVYKSEHRPRTGIREIIKKEARSNNVNLTLLLRTAMYARVEGTRSTRPRNCG